MSSHPALFKSPNKDHVRAPSSSPSPSPEPRPRPRPIATLPTPSEEEKETGLAPDLFLTWKRSVLATVSEQLSDGQRATLICELLGRLPASNRLFLVRQLDRVTTVDFISELPEEVALGVLQYLDPASLLQASQVSTEWRRITADCELWRSVCISARLCLSYQLGESLSYYRTALLRHLTLLSGLSADGCEIRAVEPPPHQSRVLCVTANSRIMYSAGDDRRLCAWNLATLAPLPSRSCASPSCIDCTDEVVAVGAYSGCITLHSPDLSRLLATCSRHMGPVYDIRCHPTGGSLISGSSDCTVRVWSVETGAALHVYRGHETMISRVLPLRSRLFSLDIARVNVWSLEDDRTLLASLRPITVAEKEGYFQPGLVHAVYPGGGGGEPEYDVIGVGSSSGVYLWHADNYTLLRIVLSPGYACAEHVVGLGSVFVAVTFDDGVALIDTLTGEHAHTLHIPQFNNSNCGIWMNRANGWLSGVGDGGSVFVAASHSGDVAAFYLR